MDNTLAYIGAIVLIVLVVIACLSLGGWITMWAWNLIMPALFHLPQITWLMGIAINILIGLIKPVFKYTATK